MKRSRTGFRVYWDRYLEIPIGVTLGMKAYRLQNLLWLGGASRYLRNVQEGFPVHRELAVLWSINEFLRLLEKLDLAVTQESAGELRKLAGELGQYSADRRLSEEHAKSLRQIMDKVGHTLDAESSTFDAYVLTPKKLDVKKLVANPETFLSKNTFGKLPPLAQYDIKQAGKCIAFEVSTAAAFHLLRATEGTLRAYYFRFIKKKRKPNPMWGEIITALRAKTRKPKPEKTLLDHLDNIRVNFRNPTDHPEMKYGIDGVQTLFGLVTDVLNRMARELP